MTKPKPKPFQPIRSVSLLRCRTCGEHKPRGQFKESRSACSVCMREAERVAQAGFKAKLAEKKQAREAIVKALLPKPVKASPIAAPKAYATQEPRKRGQKAESPFAGEAYYRGRLVWPWHAVRDAFTFHDLRAYYATRHKTVHGALPDMHADQRTTSRVYDRSRVRTRKGLGD